MSAQHTQGPWRWELNEQSKHLHLVGGRPQFDLTIIEPVRWGMGNATLMIRDTAHDGMNIMHKLHERRDWIAPFHGRSHHAKWCADVAHPDMRLIAAAPELLAALNQTVKLLRTHASVEDMGGERFDLTDSPPMKSVFAAIAKATGSAS